MKLPLPSDFIDRLKTANPIVDVFGTYVTLKRSGRDYVCCCPFHDEDTPSCYVHPGEEYFKCFGCNAGGDVITFVMKYHNLDYWEAVKFLADRGGVPLPEESSRDSKAVMQRKKIYKMNKDAAHFFYEQLALPEGKACRAYIVKRGLTPETVQKYGIGFAPNSWSALKSHMLSLGYTERELFEAGLISRSTNNTLKTFDFFVYRMVFPFMDIRGNVVGFGGRTLSVDDKRKYLNSRDTPVYNKNNYLFSLNYAKDAAVKSRKIILCEGNLDVISLNQAGFENAVASCGTALTADQVKLISHYADEVLICYDSDEAGMKATRRAIELIREGGLKASVVTMTDAKDPDEYIRKFGPAKFQHILDKAVDSVTFELNSARTGLDLDNDANKTDYLKRACQVLMKIRSPIERDIYISRVAKEQGVSKDAVEQQVSIMLKTEDRKRREKKKQEALSFAEKRDPLNPQAVLYPKENSAEKQLIYYLYRNPDRCSQLLKRLPADKFVTELNGKIYASLSRRIMEGEDYSFSSFLSEFTEEQANRIVEIVSDYADKGINDVVAEDCIRVIERFNEKKAQPASEGNASMDELESIVEGLKKKK